VSGDPRSVRLIATMMPNGRRLNSPSQMAGGIRHHICVRAGE
jgi:hypothetical protein